MQIPLRYATAIGAIVIVLFATAPVTHPTQPRVRDFAAIDDTTVIAIRGSWIVREGEDGRPLWRVPIPCDYVRGSLLTREGAAFVSYRCHEGASAGEWLQAVGVDGQLRWRHFAGYYRGPGEPALRPTVAIGGVVITKGARGDEGLAWRAFSAATGWPLWERPLPSDTGVSEIESPWIFASDGWSASVTNAITGQQTIGRETSCAAGGELIELQSDGKGGPLHGRMHGDPTRTRLVGMVPEPREQPGYLSLSACAMFEDRTVIILHEQLQSGRATRLLEFERDGHLAVDASLPPLERRHDTQTHGVGVEVPEKLSRFTPVVTTTKAGTHSLAVIDMESGTIVSTSQPRRALIDITARGTDWGVTLDAVDDGDTALLLIDGLTGKRSVVAVDDRELVGEPEQWLEPSRWELSDDESEITRRAASARADGSNAETIRTREYFGI